MQKFLAVALSLAIQAAAVGAPLVHAHPDEHETDHHAGGAVHAHWGSHGHPAQYSDSPAFHGPDHDRAVYLAAFVAVTPAAAAPPATVQAAFTLLEPAERASERGVEVVRSHDPPLVPSIAPRAPPSLLS